jgi:hypothetical protein
MAEMINKGWVLMPKSVRQRPSDSVLRNCGSGHIVLRLKANDGVCTTTGKELSTKSLKMWFWIGALIIIVALGFVLWPVRRLYLMMKEKYNERWKRAVL